MRRLVLPALLLAACASAAPPPAPPPAAPSPGAGPPEHDVRDWRAWTRVNPRRFRSRGHGRLWADFYVDPAHAEAYLAQASPAPAGMRVVMAGFNGEKDEAPVGLTVMIKLARGDWYYAALAPDGASASAQGALELCEACHRNAPAGDRLFGLAKLSEDAGPGE